MHQIGQKTYFVKNARLQKLIYSIFKGCLKVKDGNMAIMIRQFDTHKLYYVNIGNIIFVTIFLIYIIMAATFLLPTDFTIWLYQFAYPNSIYLKKFSNITLAIKIFARVKDFSS